MVVSNNTCSFNYHTWGFMIQIDTSRYLEVGIGKQSSFLDSPHPGTSWEGVSHHKLHKLR